MDLKQHAVQVVLHNNTFMVYGKTMMLIFRFQKIRRFSDCKIFRTFQSVTSYTELQSVCTVTQQLS